MTREELKKEAIKRLEFMKANGKMLPCVLRNFVNNDDVSIFEDHQGTSRAAHYSLKMNLGDEEFDKLANDIKEFEEEHNAIVYLVQKCYTNFGILNSFFFVSEHQEEWEYDWQDLMEGYQLVYVQNETYEDCSEFGSIAFKYFMGGIVRVA